MTYFKHIYPNIAEILASQYHIEPDRRLLIFTAGSIHQRPQDKIKYGSRKARIRYKLVLKGNLEDVKKWAYDNTWGGPPTCGFKRWVRRQKAETVIRLRKNVRDRRTLKDKLFLMSKNMSEYEIKVPTSYEEWKRQTLSLEPSTNNRTKPNQH